MTDTTTPERPWCYIGPCQRHDQRGGANYYVTAPSERFWIDFDMPAKTDFAVAVGNLPLGTVLYLDPDTARKMAQALNDAADTVEFRRSLPSPATLADKEPPAMTDTLTVRPDPDNPAATVVESDGNPIVYVYQAAWDGKWTWESKYLTVLPDVFDTEAEAWANIRFVANMITKHGRTSAIREMARQLVAICEAKEAA